MLKWILSEKNNEHTQTRTVCLMTKRWLALGRISIRWMIRLLLVKAHRFAGQTQSQLMERIFSVQCVNVGRIVHYTSQRVRERDFVSVRILKK